MTMAKRRTTDLRGDPIQLVIDSAPDEFELKKVQGAYRLNAVQIPTLHILGFYLLTTCIFLQYLFILKSFSWSKLFEMASLVMRYSLSSWLILYSWFEKINPPIIVIFLIIDVFIGALIIYFMDEKRVSCSGS